MPESDDGSQDGSSGSGNDYSSPEDIDSEHEEEDTNYDRKQTVLALLAKLKEEIKKM
jgi:hypothetical protein